MRRSEPARRRRGFTLVEILIVALLVGAILAVLMGFARFFLLSSHVTVSQSEGQGSCTRLFERLEDDLANAIVRSSADITTGSDKVLVRMKRTMRDSKGKLLDPLEVVYELEDPTFERGPSAILRNGRPVLGVSAGRVKMEMIEPGYLRVMAALTDSNSRVRWITDISIEIPALQQQALYAAYLPPGGPPSP